MVIHSSNLAWGIPWTEEPGGLQSMELHLGAHWVDSRESSLLRRLERGREIGR